jgi:hypothetical protein
LAVDTGEYPLYRRLVMPQSQSECSGEKKNLLLLTGIKVFPQLSSPQPITILIELLQLPTEVRVSLYIYKFYHDKTVFKFFF